MNLSSSASSASSSSSSSSSNKLLTTIGDLASSEFKSKDNIIRKLINQNNCEENTNRVSIKQSSTKIISDNTQGKNDINNLDKNSNISVKIIHVRQYARERYKQR